MVWKIALAVAGVAVLGYVATMALLSLLARRASSLGVKDGQLAPCPGSPNCIRTRADDQAHRIEPLTFSGTAAEAMNNLRAVLAQLPRTRIVTATDTYLHAECITALFRFVDDVEFLIDDEHKTIHFRSASRVGHSDLGANRKRMERVRRAFEQLRDGPAR